LLICFGVFNRVDDKTKGNLWVYVGSLFKDSDLLFVWGTKKDLLARSLARYRVRDFEREHVRALSRLVADHVRTPGSNVLRKGSQRLLPSGRSNPVTLSNNLWRFEHAGKRKLLTLFRGNAEERTTAL
jgi:hypothetical protein